MTCFQPLNAWRTPGGGVTMHFRDGFVDRPVQLPCGSCIGCRLDRSKQWAIRCIHEAQLHEQSSFITLTYSDEHLPPFRGLDVRDWQLFAKKFRNDLVTRHLAWTQDPKGPEPVRTFRYLACGEYGDLELRPHFHAAIFGENFASDRQVWRVDERNNINYKSIRLENLWGKGFCEIADLTWENAAYLARYSLKKQDQTHHLITKDPKTGKRVHLRAPFIVMSRRPGIGKGWLAKFKKDIYPHDYVIHNGTRYKPPRYYDQQLEIEELATIKAAREKKINKLDNTPERLATKQKAQELKAKRLLRQL